jgi:hypothetical protein
MNALRIAAITIVLVGTSALPALAAPVYLACTFGPEKFEVEVTADETSPLATVFVPSTGNTSRFSASFTSDMLTLKGDMMWYIIGRTNLKAARVVKVLNESTEGQCVVKEVPKRAF